MNAAYYAARSFPWIAGVLWTTIFSQGAFGSQPTSDLQIAVDPSTDQVILQWAGEPGMGYDVLRSASVKGPWSLANETPIHAEGATFRFIETTPENRAFYRVGPALDTPLPSIATHGLPFWPPFRTDTIYYGVDRLEIKPVAAAGDKGRIKILYFNDTRREFERKVDIIVDAVDIDSGVRIPLIEKRYRLFMHENERDDPTQYDLEFERPKTPYRAKSYNFRLPKDFPSGVYQLEVFTTDFKTGEDIGVNYLTDYEIYVPEPTVRLALESHRAPLSQSLRPGKKAQLKLRVYNDGSVSMKETVQLRVSFVPAFPGDTAFWSWPEATAVYRFERTLKVKRGKSKGLKLKVPLPDTLPNRPFFAHVEIMLSEDSAAPLDPESVLELLYPTVFNQR